MSMERADVKESGIGRIERGQIVKVSEEKYTVRSLDRDGITTPPIEAINAETYSPGDKVYFFYFNDGTGKIICGF